MLKKYKFGFDFWALILFLILMLPTFLWSFFPAPNDTLRADSATRVFDTIGSVSQALMVACLCLLVRKDGAASGFSSLMAAAVLSCLLYFAAWIFYYSGMTNPLVILGLSLPPCLSFLFFALDRKNFIALIPLSVFTLCHGVYAVVNFIL